MHPCVFGDPASLPWGSRGMSAWVSQVNGCSEKLEVAKSVCSWVQYMPRKFRPKRSCWVSSDTQPGFPQGDLRQSEEVLDYYDVKVWHKEHLVSLRTFNQSKRFFPSTRLCLVWNQWPTAHFYLSFPHWKKMSTTPALFPGEISCKLCWQGIWKAYDFKLSTLQCCFYPVVHICWIKARLEWM